MYWLVCILVIIFFLTYGIVKDLFHPSMIICESYLVGSLCACYNGDIWGMDLQFFTIKLIVIGILSFIIGSLVIMPLSIIKLKKLSYRKEIEESEIKDKIINIEYGDITEWLLVSLSIGILVVYTLYWIRAIGGFRGIEYISAQMTSYRYALSYENNVENSIPGLVNHLTKISKAVAYIFMYINLYNKRINKLLGVRRVINIKFVLASMSYITITLMTGGRYEMIVYLIAYMVMGIIIDNYFSKQKLIPVKKLFKIGCFIAIIMASFSLSRTLVGRTNNSDLIQYITTYFGGGIRLLDEYVKNPISKTNLWGEETFYAVNKFLYQIGIVNEMHSRHLEFRSVNGNIIGNVYTSIRSIYHDFDMEGVIALQFLFGVIMTWFYNVQKINVNRRINVGLIFYCAIVHTIYLSGYSESFYNTILSINYLMFLAVLVIVAKIIEKVHVNTRIKVNLRICRR